VDDDLWKMTVDSTLRHKRDGKECTRVCVRERGTVSEREISVERVSEGGLFRFVDEIVFRLSLRDTEKFRNRYKIYTHDG